MGIAVAALVFQADRPTAQVEQARVTFQSLNHAQRFDILYVQGEMFTELLLGRQRGQRQSEGGIGEEGGERSCNLVR